MRPLFHFFPAGRHWQGRGLTCVLRLPADKDMNTEGFSLESCRSMIALMDVSFVSSASGWLWVWAWTSSHSADNNIAFFPRTTLEVEITVFKLMFGAILDLNCLRVDGRDRSTQPAGVQAFVDQDQTVAGGTEGSLTSVPSQDQILDRTFQLLPHF